ncbi:fructose-bisphosphate aldolase, class I [Micromonospora inyonensis]|uniref:Fructose-bisphosphate aldolase, class I n=1 Tax=Micromonospora inyonensis TaxID=47866 RepID=A0A1C6RLD7_9ACTN|nr:fructose-bisphosphate aldolase, class I [Micromonospora inyonensis]
MVVNGRERRLQRLLPTRSGRTVLLPIDQPVTLGPIRGLTDIDQALPVLLEGAPTAVIAHRGVIRRVPVELSERIGLVMHLSVGTSLSGRGHVKVPSSTVVEAVRLGADAVSVQVTFGAPEELTMLTELARVVDACAEWGMPVLAMTYVHGVDPTAEPAKVAHAARVAAELGSDIVKVPWTGTPDSFEEVVTGCFAPVVVAGGEQADQWEAVPSMVKDAMSVGAAGTCVGRNIFQHHDPGQALAQLRAAVHDGSGEHR